MRAIKIKTRNIIILFFSLVLTLAVFSQINAVNPKPTSDVGLDKADWLYYKSNNDLSAYLGKKSSSLPTARYQKGLDYLEFSMTGVSSTTSVSLETDTKTPNNPTLFYRNILDGADVNYQITNIPFKIKEEIVLKKTFPTSHVGKVEFLFSAETTAKPVKQKDGSIAFFGENGDYLFQLDKPFMIDGKGNRSEEVTISINPNNKTQTSNQIRTKNFKDQISKLFERLAFNHLSLIGNLSFGIGSSKIEAPQRYTITLTASSNWLNDPNTAYPVIIDPTVTHNADANFTGQFNRIADSDTTSSTQLESSYPEATKDPYTVLLLHFNEANGTTAGIRDYASTTRVITANGHASTTSAVTQLGLGNSAAFDGTGDYLSAPDDASLDFAAADNFTIDFWIKHNTIATNPDYAITKADATTGGYKIYMDASGDMCFDIDDDATWTPDDTACTSGIDYDDNVWHHIAGLKTGATKIELFVDGVLVASDSALVASGTLANTNGFYIGMDRDGSSNGWDGQIDEVRILKGRALTPEEIKASASRRPYSVYTSSVLDAVASVQWDTLNWTEGGVNTGDGETLYNSSGLVAQWNFNETSGTTADNAEGTASLDGTLTNFASTASQDQAAGTGWTANNKKWGAGGLMISGVATADLVSITDPASNVLDPNSADLTIETWIKTSDISAEIFSNNNANGTACTSNGYYLGIDASGYPVFYLDTNGATAGCDASITSQFKINDGNWHKVAVSVTRGTSAVVYVDGKSAGSDTSVTSYSAITVTGNAFFGGSGGGLDAILDSARIYSRALSATEILSNYNAGNIEIQTRTGATSDPNDGSWEAWKPTTGETQLLSMDSDAANWHSDIMASTTIATSTETVIKAEGTGSLKIRTGMASTTAGTVALWHFEETGTTTGTTLYDETANNNDATTTGTTVVDGIFGKARKFNGVADNTDIAYNTSQNLTTAFTLEAWINPEAITGTQLVVAKGVWDSNPYSFGIASNYGLVYQVMSASVKTERTILANSISVGQWYHIALTYDKSNIKAYINGELKDTYAYTGTLDTNTNNLKIGSHGGLDRSFNGIIDEPMVLNRALSADEIAETYRMGANHHLTRQVSATDLSAQTKLAFWIAADRPGTGLEAMLGESDYANYELASSTLALSTTTVLYIKGDEIASSTSIKDSSFSGKAITANGNARTSGNGKIGNAMYFDGTGDYLSVADSEDFYFNGDFTIDFWLKPTDATPSSDQGLISQEPNNNGMQFGLLNTGNLQFRVDNSGVNLVIFQGASGMSDNAWHHIAVTRRGDDYNIYVNGQSIASVTDNSVIPNFSGSLIVGAYDITDIPLYINGNLDELRIIKGTALTPDQIRQAYEYGLRTHPITIDFGATLQTSDLISSATDYNFSLTATTSGLSATTSGLYLGDKIIIKENLGGTEYTAQGTVNAINTATGAITVPSWDTGSTFPASNGYSPNATVFKWQREYFDITGAATTTRDAITNLTLRPTNGAEGRTIYLDDFRYNTNYLTASSSSAITSSNNRYLQYRAIFSSADTFVSPFLTAFNTLYTALANSFPAIIGISGGGFLSF